MVFSCGLLSLHGTVFQVFKVSEPILINSPLYCNISQYIQGCRNLLLNRVIHPKVGFIIFK